MNLCPHFPDTVAIVCQPFVEVLKCPFASSVHLLTAIKLITMLVDGVVSQMHEMVILKKRILLLTQGL